MVSHVFMGSGDPRQIYGGKPEIFFIFPRLLKELFSVLEHTCNMSKRAIKNVLLYHLNNGRHPSFEFMDKGLPRQRVNSRQTPLKLEHSRRMTNDF